MWFDTEVTMPQVQIAASNSEWNAALRQLAATVASDELEAAIQTFLRTQSGPWHELHAELGVDLYRTNPNAARRIVISRLQFSPLPIRQLYELAEVNRDDTVLDYLICHLLNHMRELHVRAQRKDTESRQSALSFWEWSNRVIVERSARLYAQSSAGYATWLAKTLTACVAIPWVFREPNNPSAAFQYLLHEHLDALFSSTSALRTLLTAPHLETRKWAAKMLTTIPWSQSLENAIYALRHRFIYLARQNTLMGDAIRYLEPLQRLAHGSGDLADSTLHKLLRLSKEADPVGEAAAVAYVRALHARQIAKRL